MPTASLRRQIQAFKAGSIGQSVGRARLSPLTWREARDALIAQGFRYRDEAIVAQRTARGAPQWRTREGGATASRAAPELVPVLVFAHPDGGLVRIYPIGDPHGRCAHRDVPCATKSVMLRPPAGVGARFAADTSHSNEAFGVTDDGHALPRGCRAADGCRFDRSDLLGSFRAALKVRQLGIIRLATPRA